MVKSAQWIISEAGLLSLNAAGITTGWLKAWLLSAGAESVAVHLIESGGWQQEKAVWRLFFAEESELIQAARSLGLQVDNSEMAETGQFDASHLLFENPHRICWTYRSGERAILFLSPGDIAYQRHSYLSQLNQGDFLPLHVMAGTDGALMLEPGLSAWIGNEATNSATILNDQGLLIEEQVIETVRQLGMGIRTVESCTAGGIAARLCRMPGASDVVDRSWVTYSNAAKMDEVHVSPVLITEYGAVSREVVTAMAEGGGDEKNICIAVSGIAGPAGGNADKPVGTVWVAVSLPDSDTVTRCLNLTGARHEIQAKTVVYALALLLEALN
ncbi:nicotinamide-nucleotide amidase [Mariprofundus micogutta]|uniref:Nicotinamide-nucleotide amidase n=1 Tax=Mariprofundus micogutta TaxID=1921010 RepID=A0A1L8CN18_9PROT|nr:CinA family protein [Mariprofundus micogutta]GAV20311.1 nicotinamide-nucleotide amidase [Mariprofundus micogutta]